MYFLLFLLITMMIMLVVIATTNENRLINVVMIFLSILVFVLGIYFEKSNILISFIQQNLVSILIFIIAIISLLCINTKTINIYPSTENIIFTKDELAKANIITNNNKLIEPKKNIIIVFDDVIIDESMFSNKSDINLIRKIYFLSSNPTIDSDLYEKIKDKASIISTESQCLTVKNIKK